MSIPVSYTHLLSPVLSACLAQRNVATTAIQYGGAVKHKVVVLLKFKVWTTEGKKLVTPHAATKKVRINVTCLLYTSRCV